MLRPGDVLAGYRLEELVGRGGMGVVYRAEHLGLGRTAAVKVMSAQMAADERFRHRFKREARLAASIDHPNIVPVYEAGEEGEHLFIAMRFVDGTDLSALLAGRTALDPDWTCGVVAQVAAALDAAHRRGLVHRDVKPGNVLLAAGDEPPGAVPHVYLTDFGITREVEASRDLTATGAFVGSVQYAAPEQIEGAPPSAATDVYALGCVAYECLTGEPPFVRDHEIATLFAHVNDPVVPPSQRAPELPQPFDGVIARALRKDPALRWETCAAFAQALRGALEPGDRTFVDDAGEPAPGPASEAPTDPDDGGTTPGTRTPTTRPGPPRAAHRSPGRRRAMIGGVLVLLLGAALLLGRSLGGGGSEAQANTLTTQAASVTIPEGGRREALDALPGLPELDLKDPAAASVDGTVVRVGTLADPRAGTDPLPASLARDAGEPALVRLPAGEALRYDVRRGGGLLRVFAMPTQDGTWVILACETPSVAAVAACDAAAAGLEPRGTPAALTPDRDFAARLSAVHRRLARARKESVPDLDARSRSRRSQAARKLAAAHDQAARDLAALTAPAPIAGTVAAERRALDQLSTAFLALASAARRTDRAADQSARGRLADADERRARAQAALRRAGYAPAAG